MKQFKIIIIYLISIFVLIITNCSLENDKKDNPYINKMLFLSKKDSSYYEIYSIDSDGKNEKRLTNNDFEESFPTWNKVKTKIAFVVWNGNNYEIYTMNPDGTNQINITNNSSNDTLPSFSPDGTKIAFLSSREGNDGNDYKLYVMNCNGTNIIKIDNDFINRDWFVEQKLSWSPDNQKIAYVKNNRIFVANSDGSGTPIPLTDSSAVSFRPDWSPDGTKIVFYANEGGPPSDIVVMNQDGTNKTNLTDTPDISGNACFPGFSPDGTKILFYYGDKDIFVMDLNGQNKKNLTNNSSMKSDYPLWLNNQIVFFENAGESKDVYAFDIIKNQLIYITNTSSIDEYLFVVPR